MPRVKSFRTAFWLSAINVGLLTAFASMAAPVSQEMVGTMVQGWIKTSPDHLEMDMRGKSVKSITAYDFNGQPLYYNVELAPSGFILVSADDRVEPVVSFSNTGVYVRDMKSPLTAMIEGDMATRLARLNPSGPNAAPDPKATAMYNTNVKKWDTFVKSAIVDKPESSTSYISRNNMRVEPLLKTLWDQSNVAGQACYNYYTPSYWVEPTDSYPYLDPSQQIKDGKIVGNYSYMAFLSHGNEYKQGDGNGYPFPELNCTEWNEGEPNNAVTGCTATAKSMIIKHHAWQISKLDTSRLWSISVAASVNINELSQHVWTEYRIFRGGDGLGGLYNFSLMPDIPNELGEKMSIEQRKMIGSLLYDAGISNGMRYSPGESGGNVAAYDYFGYTSGGIGYEGLIANLDAKCPANLTVSCSLPGFDPLPHVIVVDGYGNFPDKSSLYFHCNMGWSGGGNAWYALLNASGFVPQIDPNYYNAGGLLGNIWPDKAYVDIGLLLGPGDAPTNDASLGRGPGPRYETDRIISGRVTDYRGFPISDVVVSLVSATTGTAPANGTAVSNAFGIYALIVPLDTYTVSAVKKNCSFSPISITLEDNMPYTDFSQKTVPVAATLEVVNVTGTSVKVIGKIINQGGVAVGSVPGTDFGAFCGVDKNPTVSSPIAGITTGDTNRFETTFSGLTKGATYHLRAFGANRYKDGVTLEYGFGGDCQFLSE